MVGPRRVALLLGGSVLLAGALAACGKDPVSIPVTTAGKAASITISPDSLAVGDTNYAAFQVVDANGNVLATQDADGNTAGARFPDVQWSSSDTSVAVVEGGTVIGKAAGNATITASVDDQSAQGTVLVTAP